MPVVFDPSHVRIPHFKELKKLELFLSFLNLPLHGRLGAHKAFSFHILWDILAPTDDSSICWAVTFSKRKNIYKTITTIKKTRLFQQRVKKKIKSNKCFRMRTNPFPANPISIVTKEADIFKNIQLTKYFNNNNQVWPRILKIFKPWKFSTVCFFFF